MDLEDQKEAWRKEQLVIASQVVVLHDPENNAGDEANRFRSIPLDPKNDDNDGPYYFGGVDVSFPTQETDPSVAVYVILECSNDHHKVVYQDSLFFELKVPYIPGYLAVREIDPLVTLIQKQLKASPQFTPRAILVDGNGRLHPRKAGIACAVGVRTGMPTIGVGKTLFYEGQLNKELVLEQLERSLQEYHDQFGGGTVGNDNNNVLIMDSRSIPKESTDNNAFTNNNDNASLDRGALVQELSKVCRGFSVPLVNQDQEVLACALVGHGGRARAGKKPSPGTKNPIYISIGHQISLQESVRICAALSMAKIPEPVRQADLIGRELQRSQQKVKTTETTRGGDPLGSSSS